MSAQKFKNALFAKLNALIFQLNGTTVNASAADLNTLAGADSNGLSVAKVTFLASNGGTVGRVYADGVIVAGDNSEIFGLNRQVLSKSANYSVTSLDAFSIIIVTAADKVMTLPAVSSINKGAMYTFVLAAGGLSSGTGLSLSPNASDKIMGNGFTSADNKDAILDGATDREGDSITIVSDGVDGWYIKSVTGTWSREG